MNNKEIRKAIEKYQKEHPLQYGRGLDVTAISSKEGADIISQTIEKISKRIDEDAELWCICEMAKMYMQGVKPVYYGRPTGKWRKHSTYKDVLICSNCNYGSNQVYETYKFCPNCGADMRQGGRE